MKVCFLLLAAFLSGHLLFAQVEVNFPDAAKLAYAPTDNVPRCAVDVESTSTDSGEFHLLLTIKDVFALKFREVLPSLSISSSPNPPIFLRCIMDSSWGSRSENHMFYYVGTFGLDRTQIDFLKTNEVQTLTFTLGDARATLRFSRRSRKALMKLFNDHW